MGTLIIGIIIGTFIGWHFEKPSWMKDWDMFK